MSSTHPPIQVVDIDDNPLRGATMDEAQIQGLWHRVTGVMVYDVSNEQYLLQKVAPNPYYSGGKWSLSAAGHVDEGETYIEAAARELQEEMGISGLLLDEHDYYTKEASSFSVGHERTYRQFCKVFTAIADMEVLLVSPERSEVDDVMWIRKDELYTLATHNSEQMTSSLLRFVKGLQHGD